MNSEILSKEIESLKNNKSNLKDYFRYKYSNDIIYDKNNVLIDLEDLQKNGFFKEIDLMENNPKEVLNVIRDAYLDAYESLKTVRKDINIVPYHVPESINKNNKNKPVTIEDIKSNKLGKLVEFEGVITVSTKIKSALKKAKFICPKCGNIINTSIENPFEGYIEPMCSNKNCGELMNLNEENSEYIDYQELKIQQPLDLMEDPEEPPKYITVLLENSPGIYCGRVKITGIPVKSQKNKKIPIYDIIVKGLNCEIIDNKLEAILTEEDIEKIERVSKNKDVINILSERLIPEIKGYSTIKKAILLQQIKGVKKGSKRADSHVLLITDPGIGKSVMLRKIAEIPGNVYGSATTASGVGLTAAVVREKTEIGDDTWVIKPGLLVKANKGTACIDELTVNRDLQSYVLEAMESQTIHINKGGINTKLSSECSILAACNPKWGRFDNNEAVSEQINIPAPMLSRFDLIFPLKDEPDRARDKEIGKHIINIHKAFLDKNIKQNMKLDNIIIDDVLIDNDFIIKYIIYARQKKPIISEDAENILVEYYTNMRKSSVQITARQLEATIRIAEAHAKARLHDEVEELDAIEAINIITESLKEIAYDPETNSFDIGKVTGVSKKDVNYMKSVYNIIKNLSNELDAELVIYEDIVERANKENIDENQVKIALKKLKQVGDIYEPKNRKYRIM
ncbi:replicative DNA helicase Mcm [Methanococcus voltae]|uniref:AAA family ATPase n=1 Tax=Methanococcus voltae TaxID=2188 RepID=UPI001AE8A446|nr:minichromosome maintenance protein MCM [Methanococcus voltae]MBP2144507.1 replicative DNA helicase Mcm [Methanococcus voltae]